MNKSVLGIFIFILLAASLVAAEQLPTPTLLGPADGYASVNNLTVDFTCSADPGNLTHTKTYTLYNDAGGSTTFSSQSLTRTYTFSDYFVGTWSCYVCVAPPIQSHTVGSTPIGIVGDSEGNIFTGDYSSNAISMLNISDNYNRLSFSMPGGTANPQYVAVDSQDNVWTATHSGHKLVMLNKSGGYSVESWNISVENQDPRAIGIGVDSEDSVWVVLRDNRSVMRFNQTDKTQTVFSLSADPTPGTTHPYGICIDSQDNIIVTDYTNYSIQFLNKSDDYAITFFSDFGTALGCTVTPDGDIWVASGSWANVTRLNRSDSWSRTSYPSGGLDPKSVTHKGTNVFVSNYGGSGNNITNLQTAQIYTSQGIGTAGVAIVTGNLWVANQLSNNVTGFALTAGASCSNETAERSIDVVQFYNCTAGDSTNALTLNISDVRNLSKPITTGIQTFLEFGVGGASYSYAEAFNGNNTYNFCLSPVGAKATLKHVPGSGSWLTYNEPAHENYTWSRQRYWCNAEIEGGSPQTYENYLLEDDYASATTITLTVDGSPEQDAIVKILRLDPDVTDNYIEAAMVKTDGNGQATVYLEHTTAWYKFIFVDSDCVTLGAEGPQQVGSTATFSVFTAATGGDTYWPEWLEVSSLYYDFTYNNVTNVSQLLVNNEQGVATQMCLRVLKTSLLNATIQVCYDCSTGTSSSEVMQCLILDQDATYEQQFILYSAESNSYFLIASEELRLSQILGDLTGLDSVFMALMIIGILAFAGMFNPAASVGFALVGLVGVQLMGLLNIPIAALISIVFVGGILIFKLKT